MREEIGAAWWKDVNEEVCAAWYVGEAVACRSGYIPQAWLKATLATIIRRPPIVINLQYTSAEVWHEPVAQNNAQKTVAISPWNGACSVPDPHENMYRDNEKRHQTLKQAPVKIPTPCAGSDRSINSLAGRQNAPLCFIR